MRLVVPFIASAMFFLLAGLIATPSDPDSGFELIVIAAGWAALAVIGTALVIIRRCSMRSKSSFESVGR